jgi:hypothetical protein
VLDAEAPQPDIHLFRNGGAWGTPESESARHVTENRRVEQKWLLKDDGHAAPDRDRIPFRADRDPAKADLAFVGGEQERHDLEQRALARAVPSDDRGHRVRPDLERR